VSVRALANRIAGSPVLYDCVQRLAGRGAIARRIAPWLAGVSGRVLDVGGGTGPVQNLLRRDVQYVCVDVEMAKLVQLKQRSPTAAAFVADGAALPFRSETIDTVLLIAVIHHLSEETMRAVCGEILRVLVSGGALIVLDAVRSPRLLGRLLWAIDRGSHPRTGAAIGQLLGESFQVVSATTFPVLHEYCFFRCRKP
jgi:ubiquinone/menaquinone biosynthesis C-methylase UbiE